ncbi:MAG: DUF4391 domain-containing protein [Thermoanaerobaculia bacterium]|nr:DUF4391 domain-containing protein [Thermoanaerobaculia bacterium]
MNAADCIAALDLPLGALVDQRVPKKTLAEYGATSAASRRSIQEGIESLRWVAALKPSTAGIPAHADAVREYLEIAVLHLLLRPVAKASQLLPFIHRTIPYPILLLFSDEEHFGLSLAHKRWSQATSGDVVVDGDIVTFRIDEGVPSEALAEFLAALSLAKQPRNTLYELYQGWLDTVLALQAACILGDFSLPRSREHADARSNALQECVRLESEMASLRAAAAREKQLPRRVELNLQLKRLGDAHAAARARMKS